MEKTFFDTHVHTMTLLNPNFNGVLLNLKNYVNSSFLSPQYILTNDNRKSGHLINSIVNALSVYERPLVEIFELIEEDLKGKYGDDSKTFVKDGNFYFRKDIYAKYGIVIQVMDFSSDIKYYPKTHYPKAQKFLIEENAKELIKAIEDYKEKHPDTVLEFYPFLGINPSVHEIDYVKYLLETYVKTSYDDKKFFYGIKAYPPLGMDPWPIAEVELQKVKVLYEFCCENQIPITTHCDNEGFKILDNETSGNYTSPFAWENVLREYPNLILDFAHMGYEYNLVDEIIPNRTLDGIWFNKVIDLILHYENVYSDISFTACMPGFYKRLKVYLESKDEETRTKIEDKLLFGSDFSINLLKMKSYNQYLLALEKSCIDDELINKMTQINPLNFLHLTRHK